MRGGWLLVGFEMGERGFGCVDAGINEWMDCMGRAAAGFGG